MRNVEKGTVNSEYKKVASICKEKFRKAKARNKLNLTTMVKDNKRKVFTNILTVRMQWES